MLPWVTLKDAIWDLQNDFDECASYASKPKRFLSMLTEGQDWRNLPVDLQAEAMGGAINSEGGELVILEN